MFKPGMKGDKGKQTT